MSVRREGEGWRADVQVRFPDGKTKRARKRTATKREAERWERMLRESLLNGSYSRDEVQAKKVPTLSEWATEYLASYCRMNNKTTTMTSKKQHLEWHLLPTLGDRPIDTIGVAEYEAVKLGCFERGLGAKSTNNVLCTLHEMLTSACRLGHLSSVDDVRWLKVPPPSWRWLEQHELEALLSTKGPLLSMMLVAARTGLRAGELRGLRWGDVDLSRGVIAVTNNRVRGEDTTTKSGKRRTVPLTDDASAAILSERHQRGPYVWCHEDGAPWDENGMRVQLDRAIREARLLPLFGWHVLRHTFASQLVLAGVPLAVVQALLGHSTIAMTERYTHVAPDALRIAVGRLTAH